MADRQALYFLAMPGTGQQNLGGKVLSSRTRRSSSRAAALLRLAATSIGRSNTALGAFYRRLSSRAGKVKAVTATVRKIAVLFFNTIRHGMTCRDPGADHYEEPRCRQSEGGAPSRWALSCYLFQAMLRWLFLRKAAAYFEKEST